MQKWEYVTIREHSAPIGGGIFFIIGDEKVTKYSGVDWENLHELLNQLGDRGYELVEASTSSTNAGIYQRILVMKRPKQ